MISLTLAFLLNPLQATKSYTMWKKTNPDSIPVTTAYAEVNGIQLYYEIHGSGKPLVLIHGGGSTIQTSFGRILPHLAQTKQLIAVELQAHGRTSDRERELSFEQDADDLAALLKKLQIAQADVLGFSNGGTTALQLAIRHPKMVDRLVTVSALAKRSGAPPAFWDFMKQASLEHMPQAYKEAFLALTPDPVRLQNMNDKCARRMVHFKDIEDDLLKSIQSPTLIVIGDRDVMTPEHAVEMHRLIPNSRLAILPGGHGHCLGEITTLLPGDPDPVSILPILERFFHQP